MLDLATSFLASVARDPEALAIVDGDVRLSYSAWYGKISGLVAGLDARSYRIAFAGKTEEITFALDGQREYQLLCRRPAGASDGPCAELLASFELRS